MEFLSNVPEIMEAMLAVLGGMRILSRYTPWKWDDKMFEAAEKPVKKVAEVVKQLIPPKKK